MLLTGRVTRQRSSLVGGPEIQCYLSSKCMQMGSRLVTNHMEADAREMHGIVSIYHMTEGPDSYAQLQVRGLDSPSI